MCQIWLIVNSQNQKSTEPNNFFLNVHNYSSKQFETSLLQLKYAVMEPSRDLINLLIAGKEHFFTVSEHKTSSRITVQHADNHLVFAQIE